jgi:hypothetical protein
LLPGPIPAMHECVHVPQPESNRTIHKISVFIFNCTQDQAYHKFPEP